MKVLFCLSFFLIQFTVFSQKNARVFLIRDAESKKDLEQFELVNLRPGKLKITRQGNRVVVNHLGKKDRFILKREQYHDKEVSVNDLNLQVGEKEDTAVVYLLPVKASLDNYWKTQLDSLRRFHRKDTVLVENLTQIADWIKTKGQVSPATIYYCDESLCSYGRTFEFSLNMELVPGAFLLAKSYRNMKPDVQCIYMDYTVQKILALMPVFKLKNEQVSETRRLSIPMTIVLQ